MYLPLMLYNKAQKGCVMEIKMILLTVDKQLEMFSEM